MYAEEKDRLSLPLWERGLKFPCLSVDDGGAAVAPLVGAWIEIVLFRKSSVLYIVAPLVGAWIEMLQNTLQACDKKVAPLVGAWIEIYIIIPISKYILVAPLVGAWIEILLFVVEWNHIKRRSPCGSVD